MYKIGIIGALSLSGKELNESLQESPLAASDFVLLDDEGEAAGRIAAVGNEASFVQRIEPSSFERMDFVFFAGGRESTQRHWSAVQRAGASAIDLTYALEREEGIRVRSPLVAITLAGSEEKLTLDTSAVIAAHPAAVMLAFVAARLQKNLQVESFTAIVMEPASQHGQAAMDELHQQTVNLLSFKNIPKDHYDAQLAFNILSGLGPDAKVRFAESEDRIRRHYEAMGRELPPLELHLVQAPVFHGYVISMLMRLKNEATQTMVEEALRGESMQVISSDTEAPSNVSAAGQDDILVSVKGSPNPGKASHSFWLTVAADNLKLSAQNAILCGCELKRIRPSGKIQ